MTSAATEPRLDDGEREADVEAARRGDHYAFAVLYQQTVRPIAAYLSLFALDVEDRDAAVTHTFLRAWRDLPLLDDAARFELWLLRIAHDELGAAAGARGPTSVDLEERSPLGRLSTTHREALCLRYLFGQTLEQVAHGLDCSPEEAAALDRQALEGLTGVSLVNAA